MSKITAFEKEVYELIKIKGEIPISNISKMMQGAIPNLKNAKLVKICRKPTAPWASKKQKFVQAI